jgi:UDP-N-acetylmuramate dehydrogenase
MTPAPAILENHPLAPLTTIGLGGNARYFAMCASPDECRAAIGFARTHRLPIHILGGGSNTIFADEGFSGLVIQVFIAGLTMTAVQGGMLVQTGAGEQWDDVVTSAVARGLGGIECLAGIPGTAGAAPIQNIGAYGQEVGDTITEVCVIDLETLEERTFSGKECDFGYRTSRFKDADRDRFVITSVALRLRPEARPVLRYPELAKAVSADGPIADAGSGQQALGRVRKTVMRLRRSKGMVVDPADSESRSAGSFFMNPFVSPEKFTDIQKRWTTAGHADPIPYFQSTGGVKIPAAWLVEHAGFARGARRGGVGISTKHALALVNRGGSTKELLALATEIQESVSRDFGIFLSIEPVIVSPESTI